MVNHNRETDNRNLKTHNLDLKHIEQLQKPGCPQGVLQVHMAKVIIHRLAVHILLPLISNDSQDSHRNLKAHNLGQQFQSD